MIFYRLRDQENLHSCWGEQRGSFGRGGELGPFSVWVQLTSPQERHPPTLGLPQAWSYLLDFAQILPPNPCNSQNPTAVLSTRAGRHATCVFSRGPALGLGGMTLPSSQRRETRTESDRMSGGRGKPRSRVRRRPHRARLPWAERARAPPGLPPAPRVHRHRAFHSHASPGGAYRRPRVSE